MSRARYVELHCDECGGAIAHNYSGDNHSQTIRKEGGIVSKYGDFCSRKCYNDYVDGLKIKLNSTIN